MLQELKFVQGAISAKDFIPALTHFRIENGTVRSFNGLLALCTPIQLDIDCTPKALPLIKAIGNCDETVTLTLTPAGRLSVKSGSFKALIDCIQEETPHVQPEGEFIEFSGEHLLNAFKAMYDFIGTDASRPWANGILLKGQSAFATNNVCLIEYWVGSSFPHECNIPRACVKEMLRIGEPPTGAQLSDNNITFHYTNNRWLRSQLFSTEWPDLSKVLDRECNPLPVNEELFVALDKLKGFVDKQGRIYFTDSSISTSLDESEGATFTIDNHATSGIYNIEMLNLLNGVAKSIDWEAYPSPCIFMGDRLRGAIVGLKG